jgi:hypothetical protein
MDIASAFLYIRVHDFFQNKNSLGSRGACSYSEAGFSSPNGDRACEFYF